MVIIFSFNVLTKMFHYKITYTISESIDIETERATPTLSVDTGIASDMMSSFTETSKSSPKFTGKNFNAAKSNEK